MGGALNQQTFEGVVGGGGMKSGSTFRAGDAAGTSPDDDEIIVECGGGGGGGGGHDRHQINNTSPTASGKGLRRLAHCVLLVGCDLEGLSCFSIQL